MPTPKDIKFDDAELEVVKIDHFLTLHPSWESFADLPKADADFLQDRPPVVNYIETVIWHTLHLLADYPVLDFLAKERTKAKRLDGRACAAIYEAAISRIDWQTVSVNERAFMRSLGFK